MDGACQAAGTWSPAPAPPLGTIEELDDVCEVHVVLQDDISVDLYQCQRDEQDIVGRGHMLSGPNSLPHGEDVVIDQLCGTQHTCA